MVLDKCVHVMGNCFKELKLKGIFKVNGAMDWRNGAYTIKLEDNIIAEVVHTASGHICVVKHLNLDRSYTLNENWSDHLSCLVKKPLPPIRLSSLFDSKAHQGPFSFELLSKTCKGKAWLNFVNTIYDDWKARKDATMVGVDKDGTKVEVHAALSELNKSKQHGISQKARDKALEMMAAKRQKRTISLQASPKRKA